MSKILEEILQVEKILIESNLTVESHSATEYSLEERMSNLKNAKIKTVQDVYNQLEAVHDYVYQLYDGFKTGKYQEDEVEKYLKEIMLNLRSLYFGTEKII